MRITRLKATPVAMHDQPLLNSTGVHESHRVRTIVQVWLDNGLTGAGETYGDQTQEIEANRDWVIGWDPRNITLARLNYRGAPWSWAAVETAMLDAAAKFAGMPLCDYIGGRARHRVAWSAYLFYKFADEHGRGEVATGDVLTPDAFVKEAGEFVAKYGFKSLKIKGGWFHPDVDIETFRLLRKRFPKSGGYEIRIDPNGAWTADTAARVAKALEQYEPEYLEDPCGPMEDNAALKKRTRIPIATNMCVSAFGHVKPAVKQDAIDIILGDHHHWGGILAYKETGALCRVLGWALSGHSNNALGVSQAAMLHACAATPELGYAADTHYPWTDTDGDVIKGGKLQFRDGFLDVPDAPGLGVEIDEAALAARHEDFLDMKVDNRARLVERVDPEAKGRPGAWTDHQSATARAGRLEPAVGSQQARVVTNYPNYPLPRW